MNRTLAVSILAVAGVLGAEAQDSAPKAKPKVYCDLPKVVEGTGKFACHFKSNFPPGSTLKSTVSRLYTSINWSPFLVTPQGATMPVEVVNLTLNVRKARVATPTVKVGRDGAFVLEFEPNVRGVFVVEVHYSPYLQQRETKRLDADANFQNFVIASEAGLAQKAVYESAVECYDFTRTFFTTLRDAISSSRDTNDFEKIILPLMEDAGTRTRTSFHPGCYSLMQNLNAYVGSMPADPKKDGPDDPRVFSPNKIDIKTRNLPFAIIRESLMMAVIMAQEGLKEAVRLATQNEDSDAGDRVRLLKDLLADLDNSLAGLGKIDKNGSLPPLMSKTGVKKLLTETSEVSNRILDTRVVDDKVLEDLQKRLADASYVICDAMLSLGIEKPAKK